MELAAEYEVDTGNARAADRFKTRLEVGLRRMGATRIPGTVTDLSVTGFRINSDEKLHKDTMIWVKLGNLAPVTARVVWVDKLLCGCAFTAPLHPSILDSLLKQATG